MTRLLAIPIQESLIELGLIWLVVWLIFRFLEGTRGARVLKGALLILIIFGIMVVLTKEEGYQRLEFLFKNFLTFATIALVIVFQPELRRGLVRLGEARLFRGIAAQVNTVVDEVMKAVTNLSRNKIGAIIALEREVPLGGVVEAGTQLNADVTAELLQSIFWPGNALHDMGVVIRDEKILAAGVQFPLAEGDEISQELGSRHRAAIGLSQEADCFVIVVSEETGAISLAERGQLIRKLSPEALRTILKRGLVQTSETGVAIHEKEMKEEKELEEMTETGQARDSKQTEKSGGEKGDSTAA